jgi:formyltetrahydrofolate-dependent phosphoribosylglycinamide formyltransferase
MIFLHFCRSVTVSLFRTLTQTKIMLEQLQKKWKVKGGQLALILFTFAIGGSFTGYVARKLMSLLSIGQSWVWVLIYILLITLLWPLAVLLISIPLGQYPFFIKYIRKIGARIGIVGSQTQLPTTDSRPDSYRVPTQIAIFSSGAGSNAQKIIDHFRNHSFVRIAVIVCNNREAGVLKIAAAENIPFIIIDKEKFFHSDIYIKELKESKIDFIVLAGFLWKIPAALIKAFPERIINIHPALLPKYGGKGMYGKHVHQAVLDNKEAQSGITVHYVDEVYDHGKIIFQATCPVLENDTADTLAQRIHALEHEHYPKVIEELLLAR